MVEFNKSFMGSIGARSNAQGIAIEGVNGLSTVEEGETVGFNEFRAGSFLSSPSEERGDHLYVTPITWSASGGMQITQGELSFGVYGTYRGSAFGTIGAAPGWVDSQTQAGQGVFRVGSHRFGSTLTGDYQLSSGIALGLSAEFLAGVLRVSSAGDKGLASEAIPVGNDFFNSGRTFETSLAGVAIFEGGGFVKTGVGITPEGQQRNVIDGLSYQGKALAGGYAFFEVGFRK